MAKVFRASRRPILATTILLFGGSFACAQGLELSGSVRAGISDTDNILLATAPNEQDETIFSVSPSFSLDYSNQRVTAFTKYQFDWYRYSDLGSENEFHRYDAGLTADVFDDVFLIEVGASRSQSIVDPDFAIPAGNLPISGNLTDRDEYFVNPRIEKTFASNVTASASYRYSQVGFGDSSVQENSNETTRLGVENYKNGEGITWALNYERVETEYDLSIPFEFQKASAELGSWINGETRLFASGGKESAWDDPIDRSLRDGFWEAGFAYNNGDALSAEFAAGERSFGSSWRGNLELSFRRGTLSVSYAESPTTSGLNRFNRGGLLDPSQPSDFLARAGGAERYISERGQVSLGLNLRRTTINLSIFDESRTDRFAADGTPQADENQQGATATVNWQAGGRTEIFASSRLSNRETATGGEQEFLSVTAGVNYRLGSSVTMSLSHSHTGQDPKGDSTGRDYDANVTSFFVTYSFL